MATSAKPPAWRQFTAEQQRAAFLIDRPVLAAAGAGAGKTAVMAVRYVAALLGDDRGPVLPDRILALSFTREAAGNLRARIERTIRAVLSCDVFPRWRQQGFDEVGLTTAEREHLQHCLRVVAQAPIGTVDAICLQWISEHAVALGVDPDRAPPEALTWEQLRERAWNHVCEEAMQTPNHDLLILVDAYGLAAVRRTVEQLGDQIGAMPTSAARALAVDAQAAVLAQRAGMLTALADTIADARQVSGSGKTVDSLRSLPEHMPTGDDLVSLIASCNALRAYGKDEIKEFIRTLQDLIDYPNQRSPGGERPNRDQRVQRASLAALTAYEPSLEATLLQRAEALTRVVAVYSQHLATVSTQQKVASFATIEAQALALLGQPAIRQRLGQRYRHVLLDEAQDLNRLQGQLIEALLAGGGDRAACVFVVGDHRQSIYGFRHAEPAIFLGWEQSIDGRGGVAATLAENFRSHPDLLVQVRNIFAQEALTTAFRPAEIKPGRDAKDFSRPWGVQAWSVEPTRDGEPLDATAQSVIASSAQARHAAELIRQSILTGREPEDHAILLRTRSRMQLYAQALEAVGIPYDTDYPGGLYDAQECHDVEAILRLAINPHDRRALAIASGGPWGGDDPHDRTAMVQWLEQEPADGWAAAASTTALGEIVKKVRDELASSGVAAAIRLLLSDTRLTARYATLPLARRRLANLVRLSEEEQEAGMPLDAPAFVARLAERRRLGVDGEEAAGEQLGTRGVRLMTVHQSKGLEWPVVIVPDNHRPFDRRDCSAPVLGIAGDDAVEVACNPSDLDGDDVIGLRAGLLADRMLNRQQEEEARLFYVACTRAAEQLHVLLPHKATAQGPARDGSVRCAADWLIGAGITPTNVVVALDETPTTWDGAAAQVEPLPSLVNASSNGPVVTTVTARCEDEHVTFNGTTIAREVAQSLGTAVHAVLESHGPGMNHLVAESALRAFTPDIGEERTANLVQRLSDMNLIPGYWDADVKLLEQPVVGEVDGELIHGICDVVLRDKTGGWHLYDWKTGSAAGSAASVAQIKLYAQLLSPHLDGPIVEMALVEVETGKLIQVNE